MPIAQPDAARTLLRTPVVIDVLGNDYGAGLAIAAYTQPIAGAVSLNQDQSFTYAPAAGFEGTDSFSYTVRDTVGGTAAGEVTITVTRPNLAPIARSDTAQVLAGDSVVTPVLANDNDPDGDAVGIIGIDAPGHGTAQALPDQRIRYTPQQGFRGIDSFTYTVSDGRGGVATANVSVEVVAPNTPPVAVADAVATTSGTPVTVDALANDSDPDGEPLALAGFGLPGHGTLALTPEQRFVYTPAAGFVGEDSFSYTVRDDQGATATGVVEIAVERSNAAPVAVPDSATSAGAPVTLDLVANDNDPDGDPLRLTALTLPVAGRVAVATDGSVTYTPPPGFTGDDGFSYQVSDGAAVAEGQVTVAVTAAPVPTFANGYRSRRRLIVVPQTSRAETATDFVLLVREQGDWLKSATNGGRVDSDAGFDLRFELEDGTKLDHEVERYAAATGALIA